MIAVEVFHVLANVFYTACGVAVLPWLEVNRCRAFFDDWYKVKRSPLELL